MIRPITGNVPCGRSNRNPSNIINILAFLNVRMQYNIRGAESQCSAGDEMQSLQCVHDSICLLSAAQYDLQIAKMRGEDE